jgi:hypothetical protein
MFKDTRNTEKASTVPESKETLSQLITRVDQLTEHVHQLENLVKLLHEGKPR